MSNLTYLKLKLSNSSTWVVAKANIDFDGELFDRAVNQATIKSQYTMTSSQAGAWRSPEMKLQRQLMGCLAEIYVQEYLQEFLLSKGLQNKWTVVRYDDVRTDGFKSPEKDVDFDNKLITIRAFNTKTMRQRQIGMTERLARELAVLYANNPNPEALLFGIGSIKGSWNKVRRQASVMDLRFHDLRHTYATRLVSKHLPLSEVGRVLGHAQPTTTYRYTNLTVETARRAAEALNELHSYSVPVVEATQASMVN